MSRYVGPAGVVLGVVVVIIGAFLQAFGAAVVVFCSVIGGGLLLAIAGGAIWIVEFVREHRTPTSLAA